MNINLREYQKEAISKIRKSYLKGYKAPLLVLPTGGGKTIIFCYIAESVIKKGNRVYILVHRQELLSQTSNHLKKIGIDHGLISPKHPMSGQKLQVASVQTLVRRLDKLLQPNMLIIDEAHHTIAKSWKKIIDYWEGSFLLGVTATPTRLDGRGLGVNCGGCFDDLIEGAKIKELIERKYLTPSIIYAPPSKFDRKNIKITAGDFNKKQATTMIDKPVITGCAIEHYKKICNMMPTICFCTTIKHAENVSNIFNDAGIPSMPIDGNLTDAQRRYRIECLASGKIKVLTSCEIISEGTDIPVVSAAILLRPTKSLAVFLQQCGRTLRPAPQINKKHSIILDHVGNCFEHGMIDDDREWSLNGVSKKNKGEQEASIRQCNQCYAIYPISLDKCPQCGAMWMTIERKIQEVTGELIKISESDIAEHKKNKRAEVGKARSFEELLKIEKQRNYKSGWAYRLYKIRQQKRRYG